MKKKSLILTTVFAMALGVGVAVGAHQSKAGVKEAEAATKTTVYYAIPSEAVGSYTVKLNINRQGDGDNWAQYDMSRDGTKTQGGKLLYVAEYTDLYDGVGVMQFQLYDGETWKSQEQPISSWTFATEYNDKVYVYGSGWADYNPDTEPVPEVKYYYSLNGAEDVEMLPHNASEVKSAELSFKVGDKLTFKKAAESYTVNPKDDAAETTVELVDDELVFVQDYTGALYLDISGATGKLWAGNFAEGYYLNGSFSGWNIKHAAKASEQSEDPGTFEVIDIELAANDEVKFFQKVDGYKASALNINPGKYHIGVGVDAEIEGDHGNLKFNAGGHFDLYLNTEDSNYLTVEKHGEPEPSYTYKMQIVGKEGLVTLVKSEEEGKENEYFLPADYHFNVGESVKFFQVQDEESTVLASAPKEDGQLTKVYVSDAENHVLTFAQEFEGKLMLDINTNNVWAGQFTPGYYLAGVGGEWEPKLAKAAHKVTEEDPAYFVENVTVAAGEEVKFIYAPSALDEVQNQFTWFKADKNKTSTMTNVKYTVVESEGDDDGNFKLTNAGTYNFYYTPESGWYSVENPGYQPEYTLHVGETVYDLELNKGTEYKIKDHVDVNLTKGEKVSFYLDGEEQEFTRKHIGNNNLDENFEIMSTVTAQVYVDIAAKTIFVGGLDFGGYHLLLNDEFVHMTENEEPLDPSFHEYYSGMISFEQNDVVRFIDTTGNSEDGYAKVFDITNINESSEEGFAVVEGKLVAQKKVDLSVYLKLKTDHDEVYFGKVAEEIALAKQFAEQFNNSIGGVCKWDMTTDTDALGVAWQAQITLFGELAPKVQNVLKEPSETALSINEIAEFEGKYEYVAAKYGPKGILGENYNFLEKDLSKVQVSPFYGDNMFTTDSNTLIIVISSVAATSVIALGILLILKKKKHQ